MAEKTSGPQGSAPDHKSGTPTPTHAAPEPTPQRHTTSQPQQSQRPAPTPSDSQKGQIRDYFRSQGKQPEDTIWELQGLKLRLKDLD